MTIFNLGSINVDHRYHLTALPRPGETIAARDYAIGLGGKGANQSIAALRAGATVLHIGAVGADDSAWVLQRLTDLGLDTHHIARLPKATGHALILLDQGGENSIIIHAGANRALRDADMTAALAQIGPGDTLLLQNETNLQTQAAALAKSRGARVIYSPAPFDLTALSMMLPHADIIAMNEIEAAETFAAFGRDLPVQGLLVTLGGKGAEYHDLRAGQVSFQPAVPTSVVDTTGAGDCFAGYFAAALDRGEPIAAALQLASKAASIVVSRPGAADAIPTLAELT